MRTFATKGRFPYLISHKRIPQCSFDCVLRQPGCGDGIWAGVDEQPEEKVMSVQPVSVRSQKKRTAAELPRRDFLKMGLIGTAFAWNPLLFAGEGDVDVWVIHGTNKRKLMDSCLHVISNNGGFGRNVKNLALKVNAAWARKPEVGANTHPELVAGFIDGCRRYGITDIVVPEHPCNRAEMSFTRSGIQDAVEDNGATMIDMKSSRKDFVPVTLPKGQSLSKADVTKYFLEADAVVNMPVAKHHGGATLTMAMKNWMGAVQDRGYWHRNDLHQCIADFSTFIKPTWTIIDATRIMLDRGPQGPSRNMRTENLLIVSKDQIAADAWTTGLFHDSIDAVRYLKVARQMQLGETRIENMSVHRIEAA